MTIDHSALSPAPMRHGFLLRAGILLVPVICLAACSADRSGAGTAQITPSPDVALSQPSANPETFDQAYREAIRRATVQCASLWGTADVQLPSRSVWVSYRDRWHSRSSMDFERGALTAETLADPDEEPAAVTRRLRETLAEAVTATGADLARRDFVLNEARRLTGGSETAPPAQTDSKAPVLAGVLPDGVGGTVPEDAVTRQSVRGDDGRDRIKLSYSIPFASDYRHRLAERYADIVLTQARRHDIPPSLILAVMETESHFNPRARSAVPAFGLMQLVPVSGARDAYHFLHGSPRIVDADFLYDPVNNIEMGAAYLKLLSGRYLSAIDDPGSRLFAVIAAYNTGAGNVARAFSGTTRVRDAAGLINRLSPEEVFTSLRTRLPYDETRTYLAKVIAAQSRYRSWDERQEAEKETEAGQPAG